MESYKRDECLNMIQNKYKYFSNRLKEFNVSESEKELVTQELNNLTDLWKTLTDDDNNDQKKNNTIYFTPYFQKSCESSRIERKIANDIFSQKKHDERIHEQILFKYSKSAALAPAESEELALSINNRSVFLLHLKKYQESINDINFALSITNSEILQSKLLCRKVECLLAMNEDNKAKQIFMEACQSLKNISKENEKLKTELTKKLNNSFHKSYKKYKKGREAIESLKLNSDQLPYVSEAVSFNNNSNFGKHLIANRDIKTGEILIVEKFYCIYPKLEKLYIQCSYCLSLTFNSIPCNNCVFAVYCSSNCQKLAYQEYHDIECEVNSISFANKMYDQSFFMIIRLFIKLIKDTGIEEMIKESKILDNRDYKNLNFTNNFDKLIKNTNSFHFYYGLLDDTGVKNDKYEANYEKFLSDFFELLKKKDFDCEELNPKNVCILKKIFTKLVQKITLNAFQLYRSTFKKIEDVNELTADSIGYSLNQLSSFLNHNCYPNADRFFMKGAKFVIFACRPIKKNEQIYISYCTSLQMSKSKRQELLKKYNFECNCLACSNDWPTLDNETMYSIDNQLKLNKKKYQSLLDVIEEYRSFKYNKKQLDQSKYNKEKIERFSKFIDKSSFLHSTYEGAAVINSMKSSFGNLFSIVYNGYFEIPDFC